MKELGLRVKNQRLRRGFTLQDVASEAGCSKSLLSKIENGKVTPAISTLMRIASTLEVTITELLDESPVQYKAVFFQNNVLRELLVPTERGYSYAPIATRFFSKKLQPFYYEVRRKDFVEKVMSHVGEEFIYILEGEADWKIGDQVFRVRAGEGLYFLSTEPHRILPQSEVVRYFDIFSSE